MRCKKIHVASFVLILILLSCNITESEEDYETVDKYKSEIYLIDISTGTNEFLGFGWKPKFNSQNNGILFIRGNPYQQIGRKILSFNLSGKEEYHVTEYYNYLHEIDVSLTNGRVVFRAWDFTNLSYDIYIVNDDGSDFTNLTHTVDIAEYTPSFSNNEQKVCFEQFDWQNNITQLVVMDLFGNKEILKNSAVNGLRNSRFILNDTKIIFSEEVPLADGEKTMMMIDVNNPSQIDTILNLPPTIFTTNDGMVIYNEGYKTIKSFDLVTKREMVIGEGSLRAISRDGKMVLYSTRKYNNSYYLMMMNNDGGMIDTLVIDEVDYDINSIDYIPSFSKDNKKIIYSKEIWYRE